MTRQHRKYLIIALSTLVIILLGVTSYIVWSDSSSNEAPAVDSEQSKSQETINETTEPKITYQTFQTDKKSVSFTHPDTWEIQKKYSQDGALFVRSYEITTLEKTRLVFSTGGQKGGFCTPGSEITYTVISASKTDVQAKEPVYMAYIYHANPDGSYTAHFGLTSEYTKKGTINTCPNMFGLSIQSNDPSLLFVTFSGEKQFDSLDAATAYTESDDYTEAQKAILSLRLD